MHVCSSIFSLASIIHQVVINVLLNLHGSYVLSVFVKGLTKVLRELPIVGSPKSVFGATPGKAGMALYFGIMGWFQMVLDY